MLLFVCYQVRCDVRGNALYASAAARHPVELRQKRGQHVLAVKSEKKSFKEICLFYDNWLGMEGDKP
jgi:hypothetical protein